MNKFEITVYLVIVGIYIYLLPYFVYHKMETVYLWRFKYRETKRKYLGSLGSLNLKMSFKKINVRLN